MSLPVVQLKSDSFSGMIQRINRVLSVLVIALQLYTVLSVDLGHTDAIFGSHDGYQTLRSHDCGAKERHKDIKDIQDCQACYRAANFTAQVTTVSAAPHLRRSVEPSSQTDTSPKKLCFHSPSESKRGPPALV